MMNTTRRRRSCSSAASKVWAWAISSAFWARGVAPRAWTMVKYSPRAPNVGVAT